MGSPAARVRHLERGYSLLEVLIVLSIIALVMTLAGPRLMQQLDRSKTTTAKLQAQALESALETMRLDLGRYPNETEGLQILLSAPTDDSEATMRWQGPYLEAGLPKDPWGKPYLYAPPADASGRPMIKSLGADGKEGGKGADSDIVLDAP
jgi:general secretion pathway protein G